MICFVSFFFPITFVFTSFSTYLVQVTIKVTVLQVTVLQVTVLK